MKQNQYTNNSLITLLLIVSVIFISGSIHAQRVNKVISSREIVIPSKDSTIITHVYVLEKKRYKFPQRKYYWYHQNKINVNTGTYMKNPLHGKHYVFDAENKLICQGKHNHGLRKGIWKRWYSNGELAMTNRYVLGRDFAKTYKYDTSGQLVSIEKYKKDQLHGKQRYFVEDSVVCKKYKKGILSEKQDKTHKEKIEKPKKDKEKKEKDTKKKSKQETKDEKTNTSLKNIKAKDEKAESEQPKARGSKTKENKEPVHKNRINDYKHKSEKDKTISISNPKDKKNNSKKEKSSKNKKTQSKNKEVKQKKSKEQPANKRSKEKTDKNKNSKKSTKPDDV